MTLSQVKVSFRNDYQKDYMWKQLQNYPLIRTFPVYNSYIYSIRYSPFATSRILYIYDIINVHSPCLNWIESKTYTVFSVNWQKFIAAVKVFVYISTIEQQLCAFAAKLQKSEFNTITPSKLLLIRTCFKSSVKFCGHFI